MVYKLLMKRLVMIASALVLLSGAAYGQNLLKNIADRAKNAVENKISSGADRAVNSGLDKVDEKITKKAEKKSIFTDTVHTVIVLQKNLLYLLL